MELGRKRSLLLEQTGGSVAMPFLVVLVFWLALIFASFGLFAPTNSTVIGVLLACALSVAGAIFLIIELDRPFQGLLQIFQRPSNQHFSAPWQIALWTSENGEYELVIEPFNSILPCFFRFRVQPHD
jgi:hypothetical protein